MVYGGFELKSLLFMKNTQWNIIIWLKTETFDKYKVIS